jgi:hypothetical protein
MTKRKANVIKGLDMHVYRYRSQGYQSLEKKIMLINDSLKCCSSKEKKKLEFNDSKRLTHDTAASPCFYVYWLNLQFRWYM